MKKSKKKLDEIYNYLLEYIKQNNYSPSYREIASGVNLKSINSVKEYLDILENQKLIERKHSKSRTIEIVKNKNQNVYNMPVVGNVAAGIPILAEQNIDKHIAISTSFFNVNDSSNIFALKVKGDSMINLGINDGDIAIAYAQNTAENGDIVIAMIDNEATVKLFYKEINTIKLQPANELYSPIYSNKIKIAGKVIGILRRI